MTENSILARVAGLCYRRRWFVVLAWTAVAIGVIALGFTRGAPYSNSSGGDDSPSTRAAHLLAVHFPGQFGIDPMTVAVHADAGVDDPAVRAKIDAVLAELRAAPHVTAVVSPYDAPQQISADRHTAFATAVLDVNAGSADPAETLTLVHDIRGASAPGLEFALGGNAVNTAETPGGGASDGVGLLAAAIVLLIAFGSPLAMALPIVTAVFGIGVGLAGIMLTNHVLPAPGFAPILAAMIGLGVGVDYALFIVTRFREEVGAGRTEEEATRTAAASAGRAVLFAGGTVVIGLLGLLLMNLDLIRAVAVGTALTVALTMAAAVTLLPALLGITGHRVGRRSVRVVSRPLAARWAGVVQRHPIVATVGSAAVLLMLAAPVLGMRLSMPDGSTQPHHTSGYATHRLLAAGFGAGYDAPLVLVVEHPAEVGPLVAAVRSTPGIASVTPARVSADGAVAMFVAYPTTSAQSARTQALVAHLRDDVVPATLIGGPTAGTIDFAANVSDRLPTLVLVVVGLSILLLIAVFRSVVIALKAAVLNLMSIGAAYGVLVAAVQWGWLTHLLGFPGSMPIAAYVPFIMFPILFGLSMDYEVFLVSRIKEAYDRTGDTRLAVTQGLSSTARVITAAAAIMIAVFLSVMLGADLAVKQLGLGLAVMVFVDATLVRMVLVPAAMELAGRANWWLPAWLDRLLPELRLESV